MGYEVKLYYYNQNTGAYSLKETVTVTDGLSCNFDSLFTTYGLYYYTVRALGDGVNYLTSPSDVQAFFAAAYAQLLPGGVLCFDCSSRHKLETVMGDAFFGEERDGLAILWQNTLNKDTHVLTMDVTFFVREEDGRYRRFREQHRQRAHDAKEIVAWLEGAGFTDIRVYGEMRKDGPKENDIRIHYTARKPQEQDFEL